MNVTIVVGAFAAVASTFSFVPQVIKIVRTRDTSGISTIMYIVTVIGFALWTSYGVLLDAWPLIVSNAISLILSAFILAMKLSSKKDKEPMATS